MTKDTVDLPLWQRGMGGGRVHPNVGSVPSSVRDVFSARWARIADCIALRTPDRMPTSLIAGFWYAKYGRITCRQLMYDYEAGNAISLKAAMELDPDVALGAGPTAFYGPLLDLMDFRQLEWPGHGANENASYQYIDREYMTAPEYDEFLLDPTGYLFVKYLPRVAGAYEGLRPLGTFAGNSYIGIAASAFAFQLPTVTAALDILRRAGEEVSRTVQANADFAARLAREGYPLMFNGYTQAPYDVLADYMRGAKNMMTDLYRRPDKIHEVLNKLSKLILARTLERSSPAQSPIVMIPLHWAGDRFMSPKQFETFYWPSLRHLMLGLIQQGLVPMPLWEADLELPRFRGQVNVLVL